MMKEKRTWIVLFIALTLIVILSGCSGLPKTAKLNISFDPNPLLTQTQYLILVKTENGIIQ